LKSLLLLISQSYYQKKNDESVIGNIRKARAQLELLIKLMILLGLYFAAFGPNYSFIVLNILYGDKWTSTEAPKVLAYYSFYVIVIAINGILEAFVHAVADQKQLNKFNLYLVIFSVIYVVAAIYLIDIMSTPGLIIANCINMCLRVIICLQFVNRFFKDSNTPFQFTQVLPNILVLQIFLVAFLVTYFSEMKIFADNKFMHIATGIICFISITFTIWYKERQFLSKLRHIKDN